MRPCQCPHVRCAAVDWVLAKMTDLGESRGAYIWGCAPRLGPSLSRGEGGDPIYPSLDGPHQRQND